MNDHKISFGIVFRQEKHLVSHILILILRGKVLKIFPRNVFMSARIRIHVIYIINTEKSV